ncbi:MAG: PhnD/SsuA/transferrin family substrate-binding protein [Rhodobacteraceae bacterium]|nr:PhnD/SsuA/transferrin family substrate-binding protein [Paracoccaceae bacterium]
MTRAIESWTPTIQLLNTAAEQENLNITFHLEPYSDLALLTAISDNKIDLFLSDPSTFVTAEVEERARALLSLAYMWGPQSFDETGALIFARADSGLRDMSDLDGTSVIAAAPHELMGWQLAMQELRKFRMEAESTFSEMVFAGSNEREVVYAVSTGLTDVGIIRAGVLERLEKEGILDMDDFRPISPRQFADFPFWVSTPVFPAWVLGAMPNVDEDVLTLVINTLLGVPATSPEAITSGDTVWQAPQNYQAIHDLLISLRVRPYDQYLRVATVRVFRAYKWPIIGILLLIIGSIALFVRETRRVARIAEYRKAVLRSEVRSKEFYRNAIEEHTVFCMLTKNGQISHVNDHFRKVVGNSKAELVGSQFDDFLGGTDQETLAGEIKMAMEAGKTWQGPLQLAGGEERKAWVQCTFVPVTSMSNELSEIAIVASDVTKTRAGASEKRFNNTLELIQDQVLVLDPKQLEIMYANAASESTWTLEDGLKGRTAKDILSPEQLNEFKLRSDAIIEGPQRRVTWECDGDNGVTYEVSLEYAQPEQDEPRLIAIYRDVSERKEIEKAKNEFIATVSHELRTPLTSMKGALGLAMSGAVGEMPEKMSNVVELASTNCDRLVMLINDILDLEKIEAGKMDFKMQPFDLDELVTSSLESNQFYADKFGVTLRRMPSEHEGEFLTYGDKTRLGQVMDNLMSNAAKFSPKGSEILVSLKQVEGRHRITIRDFGSGIPAAAQPTIFDKFTQADSSDTRSKGGTGLGLSIVKLIVEAHKGVISFVSEENIGTEFFVDLPMVEGENVIPIPALAADDLSTREFTQLLQDADVVETCAPGEAALSRLVEKAQRNDEPVDFELSRVSALPVARGRGVVGQSSIMNWMSADGRALLSDLLQREALDNCEVSIVEVTSASPTESTRAMAASQLMTDWFEGCDDLLIFDEPEEADAAEDTDGDAEPAKAKPAGIAEIAISNDDDVKNWLTDKGSQVVEDRFQGVSLIQHTEADVISFFDTVNGASVMVTYPLSSGRLPKGWPIVMIVEKEQEIQAERGVVSRFSGGEGGGRGRARRRSG